ncbi:outer membrane protein transport protein [Vibrio diazotrophicus]|uniref:Aromatic hydrocarbon degradation protein n=1 Tax=Vibrio diazotrophicus TaxID=685 RepID=A0ABX4WGJ0_VIBDI|nr:outer membrane protein transport protein [Vibrio diazotrophicus]PNI03728.1 aromatic hydrocarbon degradation protein [Vibrio diazotrophicus]
MKKTPLITSLSVLASASLISASAGAAGFQINEHSATGLGRAFAGDAVIGDNASVLSRNAAAMTLFKRDAMSMGLTYVRPDSTIKDAQYHSAQVNIDAKHILSPKPIEITGVEISPTVTDVDDVDGIGKQAVVPNIYYIHRLSDSWYLGLAGYSNFGTDVQFEPDYAAAVFGGTTKVTSMNAGISLAYKMNDHLSFGGGLDVIYGIGTLYRDIGEVDVSVNEILVPLGNHNALDVEASGVGVGANIGMMYEVNDNNRFGLSYKYSPEIQAQGDIHYVGQTFDNLYLALPDIAEFSGYHRVLPEIALHYSVQWISWSKFDSLKADDVALKEFQWQDSYHYSLGATWYATDNWALRTGYMFDKTPVDQLASISIPDSNRQWLSAGATYHWSANTSIDFGMTYLIGEDVAITEYLEEHVAVPRIEATTRSDALLFAMQFSHSF